MRSPWSIPAAGNLGGGGFMTIQLADGRKTFLDFREKAPLAATANMYLDHDGNVVKGLSTKGISPSACPAPCPAWNWRSPKYGTMKRAALIAPAIHLAQHGFVLDQGDVDMLAIADRRISRGSGVGRDLPQQRQAVQGRAEARAA